MAENEVRAQSRPASLAGVQHLWAAQYLLDEYKDGQRGGKEHSSEWTLRELQTTQELS